MAYFIMDENSTKGRDPNISFINDIHKIKGKASVNILVLTSDMVDKKIWLYLFSHHLLKGDTMS